MNRTQISAQLYRFKTVEGIHNTFSRLHDIEYEAVLQTGVRDPFGSSAEKFRCLFEKFC